MAARKKAAKKKTAKKKAGRSARRYTPADIKLLWGRAAGRCSDPSCRIEVFAEATKHDPAVPIGEIAHVAGSSNKGPRPNRRLSSKERDSYANLILLCRNCHSRYDKQAKSNSESYIFALKHKHEQWVRRSLPERGRGTAAWRTILLQGIYPIDLDRVNAALAPDYILKNALIQDVKPEKVGWDQTFAELRRLSEKSLQGLDAYDSRVAVFPLAQVSACVALGYLLTSRPRVKAFQHFRDEKSWTWPNVAVPANDLKIEGLPASPSTSPGDLAFCFDLTSRVSDDAIRALGNSYAAVIRIGIPSPSSAWLRSEQQLERLATLTRDCFERAVSLFPRGGRTWHLFYSGPAPGAVVVGQQISPTMNPPVQLYEFRQNETPNHSRSVLLK